MNAHIYRSNVGQRSACNSEQVKEIVSKIFRFLT